MHMALTHACRGYLHKLGTVAHVFNAGTTAIAHGRSHAPGHLVNDADHRAFVRHTTFNALGHQFVGIRVAGGGFLKVTVCAALLHGTNAAHATIAFVTASLVKNDFARCFFGTCEHATHHNARCACRNRFGNVTAVANAAIGNQRHTRALQGHGDVVNGSDLGHAHTGHDAGGANRAGANAYLHTVRTRLDQGQGGSAGGDIAAHHINMRVIFFHPANPLDHAVAVTVSGVHHDGVHTGFDQSRDALLGARANTHSSAYAQASRWVASSVGKAGLLGDVFDGDEAFELKSVIDHKQALKLVLI